MKPGVDMMRKSINQLIFITFSVFTLTSLHAQTKMSMAVLPLSSNGISPSEALVLTDELLSVLVQSNTYIVVERSNMESILKEQGFQLSGCTTSECAVEAGKLLGVQKMIAGRVGKLGEIYNINLRLFDVETGKIEQNISQKHEGPKEELLDIIGQMGKRLSDYGPQSDTSTKLTSNSQPSSDFTGNRVGFWIGANFPKTSQISNVNGGFTGGLFYKANLGSSLYLQAEVSYAGSEIEIYEPDDLLILDYLQLAALFSYEVSSSNQSTIFLNLTAGPALNLILTANNDYEGYVADVKSKVNGAGVLVIAGIGVGFRFDQVILTLDGRYESSFDSILKDDSMWEIGKLEAFYIILGLAF
jgi:hypothetical protein